MQSIPSPAVTITPTGEGLTFDPAALEFTLSTDRLAVEAVISVPPMGGRPERAFHVAVTEIDAARGVATDFDTSQSLAEMGFLAGVQPDWTLDAGFARLVPARGSRAHGDWIKADGDGLYRCLVRWSGAELEYSPDRRFSFAVRVSRSGSNWNGARVDAFMTSTGVSRIQLRAYEGVAGRTAVLDTADAPWAYDAWQWLDVEVSGASLRARIYAEAASAPDWQVAGEIAPAGTGAFGPGGFPALEESPVIDVRRLEVLPLPAA